MLQPTSECNDSNGTESNFIASLNRAQGFLSHPCRRFFFLVLGTGSLVTYNSFLSCIDYFEEVNLEVSNVSGRIAAVECTALFIATIILMPTSTFSQDNDEIIDGQKDCIKSIENKQNIQRYSYFSEPSSRVMIGFSLIILLLFIFLLLPPHPNMTALLLFCVFCGVFDAIIQSGLYVFAASYHEPTYSAAATLGAAISGVFANILRSITKAFFQGDDENSLRRGAYFSLWLCFGFIIICTVTTIVITIERNQQRKKMLANTMDVEVSQGRIDISDVTQNDDISWQDTPVFETATTEKKSCWDFRLIFVQTLEITWKPTLSVFLNFFFTLALFPAIILSIPGSDDGLSFGSWLSVILQFAFNAGDCAGRAVFWFDSWPFYRNLLKRQEELNGDRTEDENRDEFVVGHDLLKNYNMMVWKPTLGRLIFFPIFALCVNPKEPHPYIHLDSISVILVFLFGLSNGFIHCANFTCTPTMLEKEDNRNAASVLLVLASISGLAFGSYLGVFLLRD